MVYIERFRQMVDEIESHPLLELVDFRPNPPVSDEVLATVEARLGVPLAEPIRTFYQEANGLRLYWKIRSGLTDEELDQIEEEYDDYDIGVPDEEDIEDENPFAYINLITIEDCIINRDWQGTIIFDDDETSDDETVEFADVSYIERDLKRRFRPFDLFSNYSCMSFFLEDGTSNLKVLCLSDYYIEWDNSRITDFESYLEMLFATKGIVEARKKIYNEYRGDREQPLITNSDYWSEEYIPKLFRNRNQ